MASPLDVLNVLLSGLQRARDIGAPRIEGKWNQIMSDIQLLLLGPQVPAPAATGASTAALRFRI